MEEKFGIHGSKCNLDLLRSIKVIVLAVKPQYLDSVLDEMAPHLTQEHLLISVAAGYSLKQIEEKVGSDKRIVRVMPNTPARVGEGASGFSLGGSASETDSKIVKKMMDSVGLSFQVPENSLDAVTGVSGSGPAYIFMLIEALSDGGVRQGLPRDVSTKLAA
jgi:pyrroline-5-carboxylate reductase